MDIVIILFMAFACMICLFTMTLICIDTLKEFKKSRAEANRATERVEPAAAVAAPLKAEAPAVAVEAPKEEPAAEEASEEELIPEESAEEEESEDAPEGVWIAKTQTATLEEKYLELSAEEKRWYDEIEHYAASKEGVKHHKTLKHEDYKVGKYRIVKLSIRRGVITCEFVLMNQDFSSYISTNKEISVKQAPTVMKIDSPEAVDAAKHSIDLAMGVVEREKQLKRERRNERRRQARAASAEEKPSEE